MLISYKYNKKKERIVGIEPTSLAWKARALPLSYTRTMEEVGFEPTYAMRTDLQSVTFNHSVTPPQKSVKRTLP